MFPAILKMLQASSSTNATSSNNISNVTPEILEPIVLSNSLIKSIVFSTMANSKNKIIQIIYSMISDNPYAIFLFIVMTVLTLTIILRFAIYMSTKNKHKNYHRHIGKRIWKIFISPYFIWTGLILGIILGVEVLHIPYIIKFSIKGILFSILLWLFYRITQKIFTLYTKALLVFHSNKPRMKFFKNKNVLIVFSRVIHTTWFLVFITILLGLWGVQLGPILTGLGIAGIVVGLALQDTLSHIVGGVSLMLDEAYSEGDYVILENGSEGIIFQIGYRSTKLRTFDEEIIIIPNGILSKMVITNLSQPVKRVRVKNLYQTIAAEATPEEIKSLLLKAVHNVPVVLRYPEPYVFFIEPKGNLYIFRLNFYISSALNRLSSTDLVQQEIVRLFKENNIEFGINESFMHINPAKKDSPILIEEKSDIET